MEKIKFERINKKTNEKEIIEIYDSVVAYRLEDEAYEDYKARIKFIKELEKKKKNMRNYFHVSSTLIPLKTESGEVLIMDSKPLWVDKTKGVTYIKNK